MPKFIPSSKSLPCPVCNDTKGKCRTKDDEGKQFILCMNLSNAFKGEVVNGFKCVNPNGKDAWASTWVESAENESWHSPEIAEKRRKQIEKEERQYQSFLRSGLSRRERNQNIRLLARHCGLTKAHRQNLTRRGLTDEAIASGCFFSTEVDQFTPKGINPKTPGIRFGNRIGTTQSSLACPAFDHERNVIGYQLRLDKAENSRYRWAKGYHSSHLQNGELPLTVTRPVRGNPLGIGMCEGILKPYIASQIHNKIFLGASGANFGSSPQQLKLYLEAVSRELQTNVIDFYPDGGAVSNVHVIRSYRKTFDLLETLGYNIRVVWWGQAKKLDKDCDEISSEEAIAYLSLPEFEDICVQHGGFIPPVVRELESEEEPSEEELEARRKEEFYAKVIAAQRPLRTLSYKPDIVCSDKERYLPNLVGKVPETGILLVHAPKGSGKSHQIESIKINLCGGWTETDDPDVRDFVEGKGKKFVSVTPRVALGREQAVRWTYRWIDDISGKTTVVEGEEFQQLNEADEIGCVFDSFWKLANRDFSNHLMILDECELGLAHMVSSSTLKNKRPLILKLFEEKVRECLENNGLLILSDADLSDVSVDYIRSICPTAPVFLVDYQGCPKPWEIDFYTGHQDDVEKLILDWFDPDINPEDDCGIEGHGQPIHITTDSQDEAEALEKQLLKRYPELGERIGGIIRIDSTTTQTDFGREFVKFPNKSIEELKPKVLISTPSLGVGVSLDVPWFKHVFGLFFGTVEPSQARQQLARVRQPVPRTVWAKGKGNIDYGIMGSFFPDEIKSNLFQHHESSAELIGIALELAKDSIENQCDAAILPALIKILQGMMNLKGDWDNKHIDLRCKIQARRNFSLSQLALQLREELIEEGHQVTDYGCPEKNSFGEDVREQKAEDKLTEAEAIANAVDIEFEIAKEKILKPTRTIEEGHQIQKAFLKEELPGIELSTDFVHKAVTADRGKWKSAVKFFWQCQQLEATKSKDLSEWRYKLKLFEKGQPFLPDIKTRSLQCKAVIESGLFEFLSPERLQNEYINESPELRGFWAWTERNQGLLRKAFGMTIGKDPINLLGRLLLKVGVEVKQSRSEKLPNGNKLRFYKVDAEALTDPDRQNILQALDLRWKLQQEEKLKREQAWVEQVEISKQEAIETQPTAYISQSQGEVENRCHLHHTYNNIEEDDTARVAQLASASNHSEELSGVTELVEPLASVEAVEVTESVEATEAIASTPALDLEPVVGSRVRVSSRVAGSLRAWEAGIVGVVKEFEPRRNCYTVECEDGKLRYYPSELLEVVKEPIVEVERSTQSIGEIIDDSWVVPFLKDVAENDKFQDLKQLAQVPGFSLEKLKKLSPKIVERGDSLEPFKRLRLMIDALAGLAYRWVKNPYLQMV